MIINEKLYSELEMLENNIYNLIVNRNKNINEVQLEIFLKELEKRRYNILNQIRLYNKTIEYDVGRISNINDEYKAEFQGDYLKLYIPEVMPSYKNLKTHAYKNILLNLAEITKPYTNVFKNKVCILIKIYDDIKGWDVDNKFIKPISDALILNNVIEDDNIDKMFYCVKGEYSETPHTEVYIFDEKKCLEYLEKCVS